MRYSATGSSTTNGKTLTRSKAHVLKVVKKEYEEIIQGVERRDDELEFGELKVFQEQGSIT